MAADLPRNYQANLPAFQFILDVPVDWRESQALAGEIGDYIVMARQDIASDDWYVGGLTDEQAREVTLTVVLSSGKRYQAEIYRDGKDAQWETNPYALEIEKASSQQSKG